MGFSHLNLPSTEPTLRTSMRLRRQGFHLDSLSSGHSGISSRYPCLARTHSLIEYDQGLKLSPRPRTRRATFEASGAKQCLTDPWQESASGWLPGRGILLFELNLVELALLTYLFFSWKRGVRSVISGDAPTRNSHVVLRYGKHRLIKK